MNIHRNVGTTPYSLHLMPVGLVTVKGCQSGGRFLRQRTNHAQSGAALQLAARSRCWIAVQALLACAALQRSEASRSNGYGGGKMSSPTIDGDSAWRTQR